MIEQYLSPLVMATLSFVTQVAVFPSDSMGGLSGQDSVVRALFASLDTTAGLLYLCAIFNFVFDPPDGSFFALARWRQCHSHWRRDIAELLRLSVRAKWYDLFSLKKRVAEVEMEVAGEGLTNSQQQAFHAHDPRRDGSVLRYKVDLMGNFSQFIMPYMRDFSHSESVTNILSVKIVRLTMDATDGAAARSVARFAKLIVWSWLFLMLRLLFTCRYRGGWRNWRNWIVGLTEVGRWLAVMVQEQSVVTYSCQYKGVSTWGSPPPTTGERRYWDQERQVWFKEEVYHFIGWHLHVRLFFWAVEKSWPKLAKLFNWRFGAQIFANFASPSQEAYQSNCFTLLTTIYNERAAGPRQRCHVIRFEHVPTLMVGRLTESLMGVQEQRMIIGNPLLVLAVAGVFTPILFILRPPSNSTRDYLLAEQIVVNAVKYWEFNDMSINTKFAAREWWSRLPSRAGGMPDPGTGRSTAQAGPSGSERHQSDTTGHPVAGSGVAQNLLAREQDIVEQRNEAIAPRA